MTENLETTELTENVDTTEDVEEMTDSGAPLATAFLTVAGVVFAAVTTKTLIKRFRRHRAEKLEVEETEAIEATSTES